MRVFADDAVDDDAVAETLGCTNRLGLNFFDVFGGRMLAEGPGSGDCRLCTDLGSAAEEELEALKAGIMLTSTVFACFGILGRRAMISC